jgi:hypothetical protein
MPFTTGPLRAALSTPLPLQFPMVTDHHTSPTKIWISPIGVERPGSVQVGSERNLHPRNPPHLQFNLPWALDSARRSEPVGHSVDLTPYLSRPTSLELIGRVFTQRPFTFLLETKVSHCAEVLLVAPGYRRSASRVAGLEGANSPEERAFLFRGARASPFSQRGPSEVSLMACRVTPKSASVEKALILEHHFAARRCGADQRHLRTKIIRR